MKYFISIFILTALIIILASGCSSDSVVTVKQETKDNEIASALNQVFNETFSKLPVSPVIDGNIDDTLPGPSGGNVRVTGWVTIDEETGRVSWMLDYGFLNYKFYKSTVTYLEFTGLMSYSGYSNEYTCNYTMKSPGITAKGLVESLEINNSCSYDLESTFNKATGKGNISGSVCGRTIYYNY